ncbi:hypothetical protein NY2A_b307R [Paramecium bursaria Chlorella virus NY2A]|uniref:Uncharacterized protein b307R n=1 Tax=Paramecium bursaria Chlorella virus NY2A TaxID=46021 RepID=A7IWI2_PBCVN|nr:hypothetical protein NY2A_b307R [Paramecium bursaria Chlorella virus NY2A]ABT14706.1 hypothetical protein NY2A_b307R [Paramecium bursaria Chlorella virus NY2A]
MVHEHKRSVDILSRKRYSFRQHGHRKLVRGGRLQSEDEGMRNFVSSSTRRQRTREILGKQRGYCRGRSWCESGMGFSCNETRHQRLGRLPFKEEQLGL